MKEGRMNGSRMKGRRGKKEEEVRGRGGGREGRPLRISCIQSDSVPSCNLPDAEKPCATLKRLCESTNQEAGCLEAKVLIHLKSSGSSFYTCSVEKSGLN